MVQEMDYAQVGKTGIIETSLQRESTCSCGESMPGSFHASEDANLGVG